MNFYEILGISPKAELEAIKKAYRKAAKIYHPDINKSADAVAKFHEITTAFETLSDSNKRIKYDSTLKKVVIKKKDIDLSKDPNLGKFQKPIPPKFDLWGNPLSKEEQELWLKENDVDVRPVVSKSTNQKKDGWYDAFAQEYDKWEEEKRRLARIQRSMRKKNSNLIDP